jgi:hypothetical protein
LFLLSSRCGWRHVRGSGLDRPGVPGVA